MKPTKLLLIAAAIFMMNSAYAVQYKFVAKDNSVYTKMCVLAGNNEQEALKKILKRQRERVKTLANTTRCNDMYIANFAKTYHADLTFEYLKKYTRSDILDKAPKVSIQDIARVNKGKSTEEIILVYVGN
ncbi:DUF3718 domain-containing protein [Thalassotalea nanhaiensis]|uniref:DUF3718 domain-containing protein n=1 Tax=Thalassotalea nanhaiensis TaxID=3065648 RepID=A0ABY9TNH1_9GAMM|nr:DUF3718 domain-containing protein [Colwelliaceae bacterium SQ345]